MELPRWTRILSANEQGLYIGFSPGSPLIGDAVVVAGDEFGAVALFAKKFNHHLGRGTAIDDALQMCRMVSVRLLAQYGNGKRSVVPVCSYLYRKGQCVLEREICLPVPNGGIEPRGDGFDRSQMRNPIVYLQTRLERELVKGGRQQADA